MSKFKRFVLVASICAAAVPLAALAGKAEIEKLGAQWEASFNAGNAAGVAALYTEDAQLFPPGSEPVSGRAAVQEFWQGAIDASTGTVALQTVAVHGGDSMVVEEGSYSDTADDGTVTDNGRYIVVWKKVGDSWQIHRDIWNSSVAPPDSAE